MARIIRDLSDDAKRKILEVADHKCQCDVRHIGHTCTTTVNKNSYFVTNVPEGERLYKDMVKVLCKPCIDSMHHRHLVFFIAPSRKPKDLLKFKGL